MRPTGSVFMLGLEGWSYMNIHNHVDGWALTVWPITQVLLGVRDQGKDNERSKQSGTICGEVGLP